MNFKKPIFFILLTLFIPTVITLTLNGKRSSSLSSYHPSGKNVILGDSIISEKMDVEAFISCVILKQIEADESDEFLKAFAVIIRTYILGCIGDDSSIEADKLGLPYMTFNEMEDCFGDSFPDIYAKISNIVSATSLQTITKDSDYIVPYYHQLSNGQTRLGSDVLGEKYSYLCKSSCPNDTSYENLVSTKLFSFSDFAASIRKIDDSIALSDDAPLSYIQVVSKDSSGYILSLSINGVEVSGNDFYQTLGLASPCFSFEESKGKIQITCMGLGHGLGLSLNEASKMAANGSTYIEILNYFYANTDIG